MKVKLKRKILKEPVSRREKKNNLELENVPLGETIEHWRRF